MASNKIPFWSGALSLALFLSCADPNRFDLLVEQARLRWEKAICRSPRYLSIDLVRVIPRCKDAVNTAWGCYDYVSGQLMVSRRTPKEQRLKVLTHEMGHSIHTGGHLETPNGLMYTYPNLVDDRITAEDISFICEEYDCPCRHPESK